MHESFHSPPPTTVLARWRRPVLLLVGLIGLLAVTRGMAATLYWDTNGATTGSSGANGTWGTNTYWSTNSAGTSATTGYTSGADAVFSAGSNATGAYTVTVNGTQNVSSLTVEEGTPTFSGGTINFSDTTPDFNVAAGLSVTVGSVISGTHGLNYGGGGSGILTLTGANTYSGTTTISNGFIIVGAGGTTGTLGTGNVVNNYGLLFNRSNAYTVSNVISGTGGLSQIGAGDLTLSGTNTYTGATTITTGTVSASTNAALGSTTGAAVSIYGGGTLDIAGNATADALNFGAKQFNIAGTGVGGAGAIVNSASVSQANAFQNIALTADATIGGIGRIDVRNGSATLDLAGYTLTKTGTNQLSVVGGTITDGNIVVNQGEFAIQTSTNAVAGSGTITLNSGTTLGLWGNTGTVTRALILNGATIFNESGSSTIGSNITLGGNSTVDATGTALTLSGNIGETGGARGLTKTSAGALTLTGTNTYSGTTTISAGTLNIGAGGTTGTLGTGNVVDNSSLVFNRSNAYAVSNVISGSGSLTQAGTGNITLSGANTYTGVTAINAGAIIAANDTALGTSTYGNTIASGGALQFQGGINLTEGSFTVAGTGVGGTGALNNLSGINTLNAAVTVGANTTVGSTAGTLTVNGQIDLGASNTLTVAGAGNTTLSGFITNSGNLTQAGTGTLTLSGTSANSFGGALNINSGTVVLDKTAGTNAVSGSAINVGDGTGAASSAILRLGASNQIADYAGTLTVNSDGLFDLNGQSEGVNTIAGTGRIDTGTTGALTVGVNSGSSSFAGSLLGTGSFTKSGSGTLTLTTNLTFNGTFNLAGGTLQLSNMTLTLASLNLTGNATIDFAGAASQLNVTNLNLNGFTLSVTGWANATDYFFATNWTGAIPNTRGAAPMNEVTFTGFTAANTQWQGYDHQVTPVPEPGAYGALLLGSLTLFFLWHRRTVIT